MLRGQRHKNRLSYERSARTDIRAWGMFIVGAVFVFAALSIDPQDNCNEAGECAPWLVPLAFVMGATVGIGGLAQLIANPRRGSRIDPETGALIWWQNRVGFGPGDEGAINLQHIGSIRIVKQSEGSDEVHLYDRNGVRQFYFDEEVRPCDQEGWVKALIEQWPHIRLDIVA